MIEKAYAGPGSFPSLDVPTPEVGFTGSFGQVLTTVINWIIILAGIVALVMILMGGLTYVTAGDDSDKAESARKMITNGVIGLIIVASAFVIWRLIIGMFGLDAFFGS